MVSTTTYDALDRRTTKVTSSTGVRYVYAGAWQVVEERATSNGELLRQYVTGQRIDELIQMRDTTGSNDERYWYHTNSQGFVGALTDEAGDVVEYHEYSMLGRPTVYSSSKVALGPTSTVGNPYSFQAREYELETGWFHFRHRNYDPSVGEFVTIDPSGLWRHGQGNGYDAFHGQPWSSSDPFGLASVVARDAADRYRFSRPSDGVLWEWWMPEGEECFIARLAPQTEDDPLTLEVPTGPRPTLFRPPGPEPAPQDPIENAKDLADWVLPVRSTEAFVEDPGIGTAVLIILDFTPFKWVKKARKVARALSQADEVVDAARGGRGAVNVTSGGRTVDEALTTGQRFVGEGAQDVGPGVFRSADGTRQFRMTDADITGSHGKIGPHVHFEKFDSVTGEKIKNIHTPLKDQ